MSLAVLGKVDLPIFNGKYSVIDQDNIPVDTFESLIIDGWIEYMGNNEYVMPTNIAEKYNVPMLRRYDKY